MKRNKVHALSKTLFQENNSFTQKRTATNYLSKDSKEIVTTNTFGIIHLIVLMDEWEFSTVPGQRDCEQSRSQAPPKDQSLVLQVLLQSEVSYSTATGCGQPNLRSESCKT